MSIDREALEWACKLFADRAGLGYHELSERAHAAINDLLAKERESRRPSVLTPTPEATLLYEHLNDINLYVLQHSTGRIKRIVLDEKAGYMLGLVPRFGSSAMTVHTAAGVIEISVEHAPPMGARR